jgi:NAD-dependent deacetylase
MDVAPLARARRLLDSARRVLVLTGAGLSQESGVPTFRGPDGLWRTYRAEDLATPGAFARMPEEVWAWYRWRLEGLAAVRPNEGHRALARLAGTHALTVLNQNVDGLLEQVWLEAGLEMSNLLALHGGIRRAHCQVCGLSLPMERVPADPLPRCSCGGPLRPSVVWFGENLDPRHLDRLAAECRLADLVLAVGTSAQVWPAAGVLPEARRRGVPVLVVNPDPAAAEGGDLLLQGGAAVLLPLLVDGGGGL